MNYEEELRKIATKPDENSETQFEPFVMLSGAIEILKKQREEKIIEAEYYERYSKQLESKNKELKEANKDLINYAFENHLLSHKRIREIKHLNQ